MVSDLQKRTAEAVVNIFETGRARGEYGSVVAVPGDPGHLTYGRSQTTLSSHNLFLLIKAYCEAPGAAFAAALAAYLPRLDARDVTLDDDGALRDLLRRAGDDPVMVAVQDAFFDAVYWQPAATRAASDAIAEALGVAVVYDSTVHGSWGTVRQLTIDRFGAPSADERLWVTHYVDVRRDWLANHPVVLLHKTVYRMDAFRALIAAGSWDLGLPLSVRGVAITEASLDGAPPIRVSAETTETRLLRLRQPVLQGADVAGLQRALTQAGFPADADGIFGPATEAAVIAYQQAKRLVADGIVGPSTRASLGL